MGGKKKKGKADQDQDWEAEVDKVSDVAEATDTPAPTGKKSKKSKKKGFADLDDDDLDALEAEILRGEKPAAVVNEPVVEKSQQELTNPPKSDVNTEDKPPPSSGATEASGGKQSKKAKKKKKKGGIDDDEIEAALREIEASGPTPQPQATPSSSETTPTTQKKTIDEPKPKPLEDPVSKPKDTSSDAVSERPGDGATVVQREDSLGGGEAEAEPAKDKKKKKKKKTKEEEKKPAKKPGKGAPVAMIKKLQAAREEEERLRKEELERLKREEEEQEQKRLELIRLEQERKERQKQKEKERKQRRRAEGLPVTKKEKEAEARRQAAVAMLIEQGISIPDSKGAEGTGPAKKRVVYGNRQRNKKTKPQTESNVEASAREEVSPATEEPVLEATEDQPSKEDDDILDNWEDLPDGPDKESEAESKAVSTVKDSWDDGEDDEDSVDGETDEEDSTESDSEDSDSEDDSTPFEKAKRRIEIRRRENEANRSVDNLRSPVVCVLGHVDTGKTKILDKIRKTNVQDGEAGGITQQIGATFVPLDCIREQTKMLKEFSKSEIKLPGLLIIDTPGHESFSNLRNRGSSLCDIAILVVDLMHGIEPQTLESINILRKGRTPFIIALNKIDRLFDWQRNPNSGVRELLKRQKPNTRDQFDERMKLAVRQFAENELNVALFWEKVDFSEYIPMVPTSAITGDGMGDLIALVVTYSQKVLSQQLRLSKEVEAVVMEVKVISGLGTTVDVILRNGELKEGDTIVLTGIDGPFVTTIRALLLPQPLRELRVKNAYLTPSRINAAQGVKITAKGELDKTVAGTPLFVAHQQDEVEVLKEEASHALKSALSAIKLQERGVYVQASTLGSLEALLEFLKQSKIPYCGVNIGPVHKRDVMKASVMLEHDNQWAVILAFDVKVERDAQEMADNVGVKIFIADIIYHLFDAFLLHRKEYRDRKRKEFESTAVFPCKLRVMPNCVFNTRDPIIVGVVVEAGVIKPGTPLVVPSKNFIDIGVVSSLELNHKTVDSARQGVEVCVRIESNTEAPRLYGRHFDHTDLLVSKISRESIDAVKNYFREDLQPSDWQLMIDLKKTFGVL